MSVSGLKKSRQNEQPLFIFSFARGGSNLLLNLLLSHPGVCFSDGELDTVFRGGALWQPRLLRWYKTVAYWLPLRLSTGTDYFSPVNLSDRPPLSNRDQQHVDRVLYSSRFRAVNWRYNLYKSPKITYTRDELSNTRLLIKGVNGTGMAARALIDIYPQGTFFGLVRNGLALLESYLRRGFSVDYVAKLYNALGREFLDLAGSHERFRIVRYEDITNSPLAVAEELYSAVGLEHRTIRQFRLQMKRHINEHGEHILTGVRDREVRWFSPTELKEQIRPDINQNQLKRLREDDAARFLRKSAAIMRDLGYEV